MVNLVDPPGRKWRLVLTLLILLSGTEWIVRGPVRFARGSSFNDFKTFAAYFNAINMLVHYIY